MTDFTLKKFPSLDLVNEADIAEDDGYMVFDQSVGIFKRTTKSQSRSDRVTSLSDITSLSSLNTAALVDGQQFNLGSWRPDTDYGGGALEWDASLARSNHNGGTVFSPTVPAPSNFNNNAQISDYLEGVGDTAPSALGCFVRKAESIQLNELMFGALDDYLFDMTAAVQKAIDVAGEDGIEIWGDHTVTQPIVFNPKARYQFRQGGRGGARSGSRGLRSTYSGADSAYTFDGLGGFVQGGEIKNGIFTRENLSGPVMLLKDVRDTSWFNCAFYGGSDNLLVDSGSRGTWFNHFVGCKFYGASDYAANGATQNGVRFQAIEGPNLPNENYFTGCSWRLHNVNVLVVSGGSNRFFQCAFEEAFQDGVIVNDRHTTFVGCRFEQNMIDSNGSQIRINDIYCRLLACEFFSSGALHPDRFILGTKAPFSMIGTHGPSFKWNEISGEVNFRNKDFEIEFAHEGNFFKAKAGGTWRNEVNNAALIQQLNSDGTSHVTVIKLNTQDRAEIGAPIKNFLPTYADDSAAGAGGLTNGDFYRTSTGELRVKLP